MIGNWPHWLRSDIGLLLAKIHQCRLESAVNWAEVVVAVDVLHFWWCWMSANKTSGGSQQMILGEDLGQLGTTLGLVGQDMSVPSCVGQDDIVVHNLSM